MQRKTLEIELRKQKIFFLAYSFNSPLLIDKLSIPKIKKTYKDFNTTRGSILHLVRSKKSIKLMITNSSLVFILQTTTGVKLWLPLEAYRYQSYTLSRYDTNDFI